MNGQLPAMFVLDANVFIEAHRRYYALDICPGFWACLEHHSQAQRLLSIDRVRAELDGGDSLADWVRQAPDALFTSSAEQAVGQTYGEIMTWVQAHAQFQPAASLA